MSKGYNFVNRLTRLAHETGEKTDRTHENVYEEELSFVHEQKVKFLFVNNRKQIPLNWDPSEFKDKVSSIWGISKSTVFTNNLRS